MVSRRCPLAASLMKDERAPISTGAVLPVSGMFASHLESGEPQGIMSTGKASTYSATEEHSR